MSSKLREFTPQTWLFDKKNGFISFEKPTSAFLYYQKKRVDLLNGQTSSYDFSNFQKRLKKNKLITDDPFYRVYHLFYESAGYFQDFDLKDENFEGPLAVEISYERKSSYRFAASKGAQKVFCETQQGPVFEDYQKGFKQIHKHLHRGDAYQVNYTWPFLYRLEQKLGAKELLSRLWQYPENIGAFAHASWLPSLGLLLVSNSPECLFQARATSGGAFLESMPIKGTTALGPGDDVKKAWSLLRESVKERAELNMITDLMRNDLSRIERPCARVQSKALPLRVPGLLHQYSKVSVELSNSITLDQVVRAIFPGGSVTGAPKKRVQQIIQSVEKSPRGFYCGSTLIHGPKICAASINIRSGEFWPEKALLKLHAGGAVTLASTAQSEFEEMQAKAQSFCRPLAIETHRENYNNFSSLVF